MDPGPPEFLALNNDLILDMIFKNLSTSTLLDCRLVNKKWNKISSDTLKRRTVYVTISSWKKKTFQELATILRPMSFPAVGLKVVLQNLVPDLGKSYVKNFFDEFGPNITQVYLADCLLENKAEMVKLLCEYLPKIEWLRVKFCGLLRRNEANEKELVMSCVRQISFEQDARAVVPAEREILLLGAPNLQVIHGLESGDIEILNGLRSRNQLGLVRSLKLVETTVGSNSGIYHTLSLHPPSLTELSLNVAPEKYLSMQFDQCAHDVLIASQNTLRKLSVGRFEVSWKNIPVVFTKLHTLELGFYDQWYAIRHSSPTIVSPGVLNRESSEKFPALKKVSLVIQRCGRSDRTHPVTGTAVILEEYFWEPGTVWKTVKKLELHNHFSPQGMRYLAQVFPNVTQVAIDFSHITFGTFDAAKRKATDVWYVKEFRSLQKLIIQNFPAGCDNFQLESFLTGIPMDICEGLQKIPKQSFDAPLDEVMRPYGGLWKLRKTGLRELEIAYSQCKAQKEYPLISQATVWYGLETISGLRTFVRVPAEAKHGVAQALKHVRPQVLVSAVTDTDSH